MKEESIKKLYVPKWIKAILTIDDQQLTTVTSLHKEMGGSYAFVWNIVMTFKDREWIEFIEVENDNRSQFFKLTKEGLTVKKGMNDLLGDDQ